MGEILQKKEVMDWRLNTATYVLKRIPNKDSGITSCEMWFNKKTNISHLHIFGSKAYNAMIPKIYWSKWRQNPKELFLLVYSIKIIVKLWNPGNNKIQCCSSLKFDGSSELTELRIKESECSRDKSNSIIVIDIDDENWVKFRWSVGGIWFWRICDPNWQCTVWISPYYTKWRSSRYSKNNPKVIFHIYLIRELETLQW